MDTSIKERIETMVQGDALFLFMKGNPTFPQCGFSNQVVQILKAFEVPFGHFDVLSDMDIRQGIKTFSDWPTIPQLFIKGEFVGGCDIVRESWETGELKQMLQEAFPDQTIEGPQPPAKPKNITPLEAQAMLTENSEARFLDVRTTDEREIAKVVDFELLDQKLAEQILESWNKDTHLVFMCHFGGRSAQAAEFFANQGFRNTFNVAGGIDAWSTTVDQQIPRY